MTTEQRRALKLTGGPEYGALLAAERANRARFRARRGPDGMRELRQGWGEKYGKRKNLKGALCLRARRRAREAGFAGTIRATDLVWPTHCPVLGIELDYTTKRGSRNPRNPANQSLDRWDNTKGYVPGNVYVISQRANALKNNATWTELEAVARYARYGV